MIKRLQKVIKKYASFVIGKFADDLDVIKLNWSPMPERVDHAVAKLTHKILHRDDQPSYLSLEWNSSKRQTRAVKNNEFTLVKDKCDHTFKSQAATVYNNLPLSLRKCEKHDIFCGRFQKILP